MTNMFRVGASGSMPRYELANVTLFAGFYTMNIMMRFLAILVLFTFPFTAFSDDELKIPFEQVKKGSELTKADKDKHADAGHEVELFDDLDDLFDRAKEHKIKNNDGNLTPRKFLLKSKAEDNNFQAVLFRNIPEPVDEILVTEKQLYNIDKSREAGERKMNKKNINVSAESSLSASFSKNPNVKKKNIYLEENPKDYRAEAIKHREAISLEQQRDTVEDNYLYKDRAGSLSASFE